MAIKITNLDAIKGAGSKNPQAIRQNWYSGNSPTTRDVLGRIGEIYEHNKLAGNLYATQFAKLQQDPTTQYYNPYKTATNKAVSELASYGIDTSVIDDDFFERNKYLTQYLNYNGQTNTPSSPGKKASAAEKAAYAYYQIWNSESATKKAEQQWSDLQNEINYWVNRKDRNYSDDEVLAKIDWSKYGELTKMDENKYMKPNEYNRAIGYSQDALYGVLWAARNGGGTGNIDADIAYSVLGRGNQWKDNPAIAAKLDAGNLNTYSPYSVGSTMEKEGLYFGVDSFDQKWVDENRSRIMNSGNETAIKYFGNVVDALDYTNRCKQQLDDMHKDINSLLMYSDNPDDIIDTIQGATGLYKDLFALDETLVKGPSALKATTSAIDYRWTDIEKEIRDRCAEKQALKDALGLNNDYASNPDASEATKALYNIYKANMNAIIPTIMSAGTDVEKNAAATSKAPDFEAAYKELTGSDVDPTKLQQDAMKLAVDEYIGIARITQDFERHTASLEGYKSEKNKYAEELASLREQRDATAAMANMTPGEYANLSAFKYNPSKPAGWDLIMQELDKGPGEPDPFDDSNDRALGYSYALNQLYKIVTGTNGEGVPQEYKEEKAKQWYSYINRHTPVDKLVKDANRQESYDDGEGGVDEIEEEINGIEIRLQKGKDGRFTFESAYDANTGMAYGADRKDEVDKLLGDNTINREDSERLAMLEQREKELDEKIQQEQDYIDVNQSIYDEQMQDKAFLMDAYAAAAATSGGAMDENLLGNIEYATYVSGQYEPTQWDAYTVYDYAVQSGEVTAADAAKQASSNALLSVADAKSLTETLAMMDSYGIPVSDEERKNIQRRIDKDLRDAKSAAYYTLDLNTDFEAVSAKGLANKDAHKNPISKLVAGEINDFSRVPNADLANSMSDGEKKRYMYLLEKDGEQAALDYFWMLADPDYGILQTRSNQELQERLREFASQNFGTWLLSTVASFGSNVIGGPSALLYEGIQWLRGKEVNPYNSAFNMQTATSAFRGGSEEWLMKVTGDSELAKLIYNAGTSFVDSFINGKITGALLKTVGEAFSSTRLGKFISDISFAKKATEAGNYVSGDLASDIGRKLGDGSFIGKVANTAVRVAGDITHASTMGLNAASAAYRDAIIRGGSEEQAMAMFWTTFWAETGSEAITFDNLNASLALGGDEARRSFTEFVKQWFKNGAQEFFGEGINEWVEQNADKIVMGSLSEYENKVKFYTDQGYPESLARQLADKEVWKDVLMSGAAGFLSSTMGTAVEYGIGRYASREKKTKPVVIPGSKGAITTEDVKTASGKRRTSNGQDAFSGKTRLNMSAEEAMKLRRGRNQNDTDDHELTHDGSEAEQRANEMWEEAGKRAEEARQAKEEEGWVNDVKTVVGPDGHVQTITRNGAEVVFDPVSGQLVAKKTYEENKRTRRFSKDISLLTGAYQSDATGAATAIASVFNTGRADVDRAASQALIMEMSRGRAKRASRAVQGLMIAANFMEGDEAYQGITYEYVKKAITYAALTDGAAHDALQKVSNKASNGTAITKADVIAIVEGLKQDRQSDPAGFDNKFQTKVRDYRIAAQTAEIVTQDKDKIKAAQTEVKKAKDYLAQKQQEVADAEEANRAAKEQAIAAKEELKNDPSNDNVAKLQHTWAKTERTDALEQQRKDEAAAQEKVVKDAEEKAAAVYNDSMNNARQAAVQTDAQNEQARAEQEYTEAVVTLKPTYELGHTVRVYTREGNPVDITGVYDRIDTGHVASAEGLTEGNTSRYNLGMSDSVTIYTTADGRLVMGESTNGQNGFGSVVDSDSMELADASDNLLGENANGSDALVPQNRPAVYFPSSFPVEVNGQQIQMIGLVGKTNLENEEYPVILGMDGKHYSTADENFDIPFDYVDVVDDAFYANADNLEPAEYDTITEGNVNAGEERQESSGQTGIPVPGNVGEGNNEGQLAPESQLDVGRGDNSNDESPAAQEAVGRGEEGTAESDGQRQGGITPGLRRLITRRLESKGATDLNLEETDYERFSSALDAAKAENDHGLFVDEQKVADLEKKGAIVLMSPDGMAGVAVGTKGADKGNIVGVFKNPNSNAKQAAASLIINAIANGGNKLDCYDGKLRTMYSRVGMIPVARVAWNDSYHRTFDENGNVTWTDGWNYDRDGTPDVIVWMHSGDSAATVAQRYGYAESDGGYHVYTDEEIANLVQFDDILDENGEVVEYGYDRALKFRDGLLAKGVHSADELSITHSMSVENAIKTLKNGGFPAPSIAITRKGVNPGSSAFGNDNGLPVTVVFGTSTIDPSDSRNIVYGKDSGTNVFPYNVDTTENGLVRTDTGEHLSLEDVVKMMFPEGESNVGAKEKTYSSIDEIINDIGRIVDTNATALNDSFGKEFGNIFRETKAIYDAIQEELVKDGYTEKQAKNIRDAISSYYSTCSTFDEARQKIAERGTNISEELLDQLEDTYKATGAILSRYMEAKPMRPVGLDETLLWVIPKGATELENMLKERGLNYKTITDESEITGILAAVGQMADNISENVTPVGEDGEPVITPTNVNEQQEDSETFDVDEFLGEPPVTPTNVNTSSEENTTEDVNEPPTPPSEPPTPPSNFGKGPVGEGTSDFKMGKRQFGTKTAQQSEALHKQVKDYLFSNSDYAQDTNEAQMDRALSWMEGHMSQDDPSGFYGAMNEAESDDFNYMSADGQARMLALMGYAATNNLVDAETRLADLYNKQGTQAGQTLQARKIFRLMTPSGRKAFLLKECQRINEEYSSRGKRNLDLKVSNEVLEMAANAKSEAEFEAARKQMEKELASQIPSDWRLKMRTFRMAAMLLNPRTHVRNLEGNWVFAKTMLPIKNAIGAVIENAKGVEIGERTKALKRTKESIDFATRDADMQKSTLQGTGKLAEIGSVEAQRQAFGTKDSWVSRTFGKRLQWLADKNSEWLEKEDWVFLRRHYINAMSSFMSANGYTEADMKGKTLQKARAYATLEAQKATYRDANKLAKWLSDQSNKPAAMQFAINAVLPFTKTPMNIVRRGAEYSPFGLIQSLATAKNQLEAYKEWEDGGFKTKKPKNAKSPGEVYDRIASGMTGSMIVGLGYALARAGLLKVKPNDAEKKEGSQDYSLEMFGLSFGIGNMPPTALPLLLGGSIYEEVSRVKGEEDVDLGRILQAFGNMFQPTMETTMFMSLNNLLESPKYNSSGETYSPLVQKVLANYASSYFPAFVNATAKTADPIKRKAYVKSGDSMSQWTALFEQTQNKIPFLSTYNVPYLNAWGEEGSNASFGDYAMAFLENFILPDNINKLTDSELDQKLEEISTKTGVDVRPNATNEKYITVNNEKKIFDDKQWYEYSSSRGKESKRVLQELIERPEFVALDAEVQANLVKKVYKYAQAKAAKELFPEKEITDKWTQGALTANNVVDYIFEKEEESAARAAADAHRQSLYKAIDSNDIEAARTDIDILRTAGTSDSSIKSSITNQFKPLYKQAYEDGDYDEMNRIRTMLRYLDLGYEGYDFRKWLK